MNTKKNLLIVCEGTNTEPEYFHQLRNDLINRNVDYSITIKPKPPAETEAERIALQATNPVARTGARRRQTTNAVVPDEEFMVEAVFLAQPTRYVREAQLGLIDGTYDEAWAVYDRNGHSEHPEALALATAEPLHLVHIGFSSIAFEQWLLLHFEYSDTAFIKSQCRRQHEVFSCGQHTHPQDCLGAHCISGYMKEQGHIDPKKNIKELGYSELAGATNNAFRNAFSLRRAQLAAHPNVPIYQLNPITTVDRLVLKLLKEPFDLIWSNAQPIIIGHHTFSFEVRGNQLRLEIQNNDKAGFIFSAGHFILLDVIGNHKSIFERFATEKQSITNKRINLGDLEGFEPVYIGFKMREDQYAIIEI